jgi:exodeoxyribonuclease-3
MTSFNWVASSKSSTSNRNDGKSLKIATWNVNSIRSRLEHVSDFLSNQNPDILLLQETKCTDDQFPHDQFSPMPYNISIHGQKSYNGVAIFSKYPIDEVKNNFDGNPIPDQARFLEITCDTPVGYSRIISVYVPNGGEVGSDKFAIKLDFLDGLKAYLDSIQSEDENLIIGGDFNVAPFDIDVYDPEVLKNTTCCTEVEKERMRVFLRHCKESYRASAEYDKEVIQSEYFIDKMPEYTASKPSKMVNHSTGLPRQSLTPSLTLLPRNDEATLIDLYRIANPDLQEFSWWDYRAAGFARNHGLRIDFLLSNASAAKKLKECYIDKSYRSLEKPSDHVPVVAVFGV